MKFSEIYEIERLSSSFESKTIGFQNEIINDYIEKEKKKLNAHENPFIFFIEDITASALSVNFQSILGSTNYKHASDDAKNCLKICNDFFTISSWSVNGWLQNSLQFVNYFVLHYIQNVLKELPKTYPNAGTEKARYIQLSEDLSNDASIAGYKLIELYNLRNDLEHRTITHPDGRQELIPPNRGKARKMVVKLYPDVLKRFIKIYST